MAILPVYQAKVLKDLHEGVPDPELLQELRSATDYALRATKVTAQALGRAMSTMVVQERHLWLNLAEMRDAEKVRFLDAPISQAGLFGETVVEFAQQFSMVKKQTEAIKHISNPCLLCAEGGHLREQLRPRNLPVLQLHPPCGPARVGSHGAPILGTSGVTPLRPLAENILDWLNLPNPSHWLLRTIRLGYAVQILRSPPKFWGVLATSVRGGSTTVLRAEIAVLLAKGAIETVPSAEMKKGFYSPYFTVPKKGGGLRPILDLRDLNQALLKLPFKMLTLKHILMEVGIRILNYLDGWLILAHSDVILNHLAQLGLRVNWEKSKLSPEQRISFHGVELDSVDIAEVYGDTQMRVYGPSKTGSEASRAHGILSRGHGAGLDAHETAATLDTYPSPEMGMAPGHASCEHHTIVLCSCGQERIVVTTDASKTGWGAICNWQAASGVWSGPRLLWHINCLELLTVLLALKRFRSLVQGKHVLVRSDNTPTVAYINHQGGVRSFRMSQLAHHRLRSLRATHILGEANRVADSLSRQASLGGEWRLHPQAVQLIWDRFGQAQVDLFASPESTHCQCTGTQLAEEPAQPHCTNPVQSQRGQGTDSLDGPLLAPQNLVLLASAPPWRISLRKDLLSQGKGTIWHPRPDLWNLHLRISQTFHHQRLYDLKWRIFVNWCSSRGKDPRRCGIEHLSASSFSRFPDVNPGHPLHHRHFRM
ncbi:hypothetical protein M9458_052488 [Cirrhinus mrigala]|uniref:Reverse transcriptase RNase H-like domain-containing protein n=1 Tax=Cirrhinus mrigala TaxID=683832 RepID=A0ABD0MRU9_CIRMR